LRHLFEGYLSKQDLLLCTWITRIRYLAAVLQQHGFQKAYAAWERRPVALRPEQIEQLTDILGISPNYLFGKTKKLILKPKD
jgi:hypothetical protein